MIYLDNAATTLYKPRAVEQAVRRAMYGAAGYARGGYAAASRAGELVYACREQAAALFGVGEPERVIFTLNATHALNIAINALVKPDSRVIVSGYEHNAVMRPLTARNIEPTVLDTPLWDGAAMVSALKQALEHGADLMILSHVSNVFGSIAPLDEIAELLTAAGVPLILDASQSAGVAEIDVKRYPCLAAVCMPGHKALYGPMGTGILLALDDRIAAKPLLTGGTGSLSRQPEMPDFLPDRLEAGTHNVPGVAGLLEGLRFLRRRGIHSLFCHEAALVRQAAEGLAQLPRVQVYSAGEKGCQSGVLSFRVAGRDPGWVAEELGQRGIAVRAGLHCAPLAHATGGTEATGTVRVSFSAFNTGQEVERFLKTMRRLG